MKNVLSLNALFSQLNDFNAATLQAIYHDIAFSNVMTRMDNEGDDTASDYYQHHYVELVDSQNHYYYVWYRDYTRELRIADPSASIDHQIKSLLQNPDLGNWQRLSKIIDLDLPWGPPYYAPEFSVHNDNMLTAVFDYLVGQYALTSRRLDGFLQSYVKTTDDELYPFETPYQGPEANLKLPKRDHQLSWLTGVNNGQLYLDIDKNLMTYYEDTYRESRITDFYLPLVIPTLDFLTLNQLMYELKHYQARYHNVRTYSARLRNAIYERTIQDGEARQIELLQQQAYDLTTDDCLELKDQLTDALAKGAQINVVIPMHRI